MILATAGSGDTRRRNQRQIRFPSSGTPVEYSYRAAISKQRSLAHNMTWSIHQLDLEHP
jgi:hypothetical protein